MENFEATWQAERRGEIPERYVIEAVIQSTTDLTLAPEGKHTLTLGVKQLPFELADGHTWDGIKEIWADKVVAELFEYAPNLKDHILDRAVITPQDLERDYLITGGNIFHGRCTWTSSSTPGRCPDLVRIGRRSPVTTSAVWACTRRRRDGSIRPQCGADRAGRWRDRRGATTVAPPPGPRSGRSG